MGTRRDSSFPIQSTLTHSIGSLFIGMNHLATNQRGNRPRFLTQATGHQTYERIKYRYVKYVISAFPDQAGKYPI